MPLLVVLIVVIILVVAYRRMTHAIVRHDEHCKSAWQTVDEQLQRRNTLVSHLLEFVGPYASENAECVESMRDVQRRLDAANEAGTSEQKMSAAADLTSELNTLFANLNNVDELKTSDSYSQLQEDLSDCDNKLSYARIAFNDCVTEYNDSITTPLGRFVAGSKFRKRTRFDEVGDTAQYAALNA